MDRKKCDIMKWTQINSKSQEELLCQSKKEQCHLVMTMHSRAARSRWLPNRGDLQRKLPPNSSYDRNFVLPNHSFPDDFIVPFASCVSIVFSANLCGFKEAGVQTASLSEMLVIVLLNFNVFLL